MTKQGTKSYSYGWMNKVMSISENGKVSATYDYHVDGQVASMTKVGSAVSADSKGALATAQTTNFYWDGLALIKRGDMSLTNEPYVTGGNPVIAGDRQRAGARVLFNDMLGTTQGSTDGKDFAAINRDAFGQTLDNSTDSDYDYFTGKPKVEGLGYAFLFRNYNAGLGKWTTSDPLGYPDGWNNFAYCNNGVTDSIDWLGGVTISSFFDALYHYAVGVGVPATIGTNIILQSTSTSGYQGEIDAVNNKLSNVNKQQNSGYISHSGSFSWNQGYVLGRNTMAFNVSVKWSASGWVKVGNKYQRTITGTGNVFLSTTDRWDFDPHDESFWDNFENEYGPEMAANMFSLIVSGGLGEAYDLSGGARVSSVNFTAVQYE